MTNDPRPDSGSPSPEDLDSAPLRSAAGEEVLSAPADKFAEMDPNNIPAQGDGEFTHSSDPSSEDRTEDGRPGETDNPRDSGKPGTHATDDPLIQRVNAALEAFHARAERYEETNRFLHSRIESLQSDQVRALLKPVFERLAALQTQAVNAATDARDRDSSSAVDFDFFAISIDELLALYDVEPVGAEPGLPFDSKIHHGARIVPTTDSELDGRIQRVQRQGYKFAGADRVMLPARVSVYRYTAPEPPRESVPDVERTIS